MQGRFGVPLVKIVVNGEASIIEVVAAGMP